MKKLTDLIVKHVVSEPGDHTKYDYLVIKKGNYFYFMGYSSTFPFPKCISLYDAKGIKTIQNAEEFRNTSNEYEDVNPWTILECADTINNWDSLTK